MTLSLYTLVFNNDTLNNRLPKFLRFLRNQGEPAPAHPDRQSSSKGPAVHLLCDKSRCQHPLFGPNSASVEIIKFHNGRSFPRCSVQLHVAHGTSHQRISSRPRSCSGAETGGGASEPEAQFASFVPSAGHSHIRGSAWMQVADEGCK